MDFLEVLLHPQNVFFAYCLGVSCALAIIEIADLLLGGNAQNINKSLPDLLDVDFDAGGVGAGSVSLLVAASNWLQIGKTSFLIWLFFFFGGWGVLGILLQSSLQGHLGVMLLTVIAIPATFVINLFVIRYLCIILDPILPKDETAAINEKTLTGLTGEIVVGMAIKGFATQVKVKDQHGTWHYIMGEPDEDGVTLNQGDQVGIGDLLDNGNFVLIPLNLTSKTD